MTNFPNINTSSPRSPVQNNRRVEASVPVQHGSAVTPNTPAAKQAENAENTGFVDRRRTPDRRKAKQKPIVDTRNRSDRRRSMVDLNV